MMKIQWGNNLPSSDEEAKAMSAVHHGSKILRLGANRGGDSRAFKS
jgi:hypothetical protein